MGLTDEQYGQVLRYVDGEMDASEKTAFEASLVRNVELLEEVKSYKEIRLLGESITEKINARGPATAEKNSKQEDVWSMLQKARKDWEEHEDDLRHKPSFFVDETPEIQRASHDREEAIKQLPSVTANEKARVHPLAVGDRKVKKMNLMKWLAAAVTISFICLGALWWYEQNGKDEHNIVINSKKTIPHEGSVNNEKSDSLENVIDADTSSLKMNPSSTDSTSRSIAVRNTKTNRAETERLVKKNFVPDSLPSQEFDALQTPAAYYKDHRHEEAIVAYKKVIEASNQAAEDPGLISRGQKERELILFLAHYYLGQSYLSVGDTTGAIRELKSAIKRSPDKYWKSKAEWYLALAYLKADQIIKARKLLKQVASKEEAGAYRQKAIELSWQLEKQ